MFFVVFHLSSLHVFYWMLILKMAYEESLTGVGSCESGNIVGQGGKMMFGPSKAELSAVLLTPASLQGALLQWEETAQHTLLPSQAAGQAEGQGLGIKG